MEVLSDKFLLFLVPVYIYIEAKDVRLLGLLTLTQWLPRVLLQPFLGATIAKFPFRKQIITISSCKAVLCIILLGYSRSIPVILVAASFLSILNGCSFINLEFVGSTLKDSRRRATFQTHIQTIDRSTRVLGPALGGFALLKLPFSLSCILAAALFLTNLAILCLRMDIVACRKGKGLASIGGEVLSAAIAIFSTGQLRSMTVMMMAGNFLEGTLLTILPKIVVTNLGYSAAMLSYIEIITATATILFLYVLPRLTDNTETALKRLFPFALLGMPLSCAGFAISTNILLLTVSFGTFFVAQSITTVYIRAERVRYIREADFPSTIGAMISIVQLTIPLSGYLVTLFPSTTSLRILTIVQAVLVGLVLVVMILIHRSFGSRLDTVR
ncbi:hypothetical protein PQR40_36015 [Paraburkholderia sediminicola]